MFNKKEYRIAKKINADRVLTKYTFNINYNALAVKCQRLCNFKLMLLPQYKRTVISGSRNVCSLTGNYRSVFNSMRVSRHVYRDLGGTSFLPNFSKASWQCLTI